MIGIDIMKASVREVSVGAVIVVTVLVAAGCELPAVEQTVPPATTTPGPGPAGTGPPPATVTAMATPSPVASPEVRAVETVLPAVTVGPVHVQRSSACTTGLEPMRRYASDHVARWTADGTHILLTYNSEVWAVTPDASRLWRLAQAWGQTEPGTEFTFGWMTSFDVTRDGKHVVYATCRYLPDVPRAALMGEAGPFRFDYEIAVVGLDGKTPRRLTRHNDFDNYPAWSPDGTRVAFVSNRDVPDIEKIWRAGLYTMAADGTDVRRLAAGLEGVAWQPPAWSPDGRSLAVAGVEPGGAGHGLYLVHTDGAGFVRLADAISGGAWSPDGARLAFAKPEGAGVALYTITVDGADAQRVTTVHGWELSSGEADPRQAWIDTVSWSPDGSKLLYACGEGQFCVVTLDGQRLGEPCQGWADGPACYSRDGRQLTGTSLVGERAVWSSDGARIAVTTPGARGRRHGDDFLGPYPIILYSAAPDGSDVRPLVLQDVGRLVAAKARDEDLATSRAACAAGFVVPAPAANPGLVSDCETLLAARAALAQGPLANWGSGSPLELWEGVTITGTPPRVTGLALPDRDLHGTIPPALGGLDYLQRLNLFRNYYLSGPIPPELGQLTHLKQLYLARNRLTGCIPVGLKRVPDNDLAKLGLPDCEAGS